ncbi:MAG: FAD-binding domain-containing protein [Pseudomonadota bacterium]
MTGSGETQIVWFKRDLRVADHRPLARAAERGPVLPLFVVEPDLWQQPDMSARQWGFVQECLTSLRSSLAELGQPLVVRVGDVTDVLEQARMRFGSIALWSHEETGNAWTYARDRRVLAWVRQQGIVWQELRQAGVIRRLTSRNGWAKSWDAFMAEPIAAPPLALPPLAKVDPGLIPTTDDLGLKDDPCPQRQAGGRGAAAACIESFLHERGAPYRRAMSNPAEGAVHCSRISPHLAWGTLSMREVAQATAKRRIVVKAKGVKGGWPGSLSSFEARLHWRDHFTQKLEDEPSLEFRNLHRAYDGLRPSEPDAVRLAAWSKGETGLPFVDACMRALTAMGWMNFRMRAMLMAVASYHLWLDWRQPGEHLARLFTDYEPGIHWPQVQMQSGTTGINTIRIYNPIKQGQDQDPAGRYIRQWIPELADVPDEFVHEPWRWDGAAEILDRAYPLPIVDHLAAAKDARQKVWAVRGNRAFGDAAAAVQQKHGSRKSGIRMRGQRPRQARDGNQLSLAFGQEDQAS